MARQVKPLGLQEDSDEDVLIAPQKMIYSKPVKVPDIMVLKLAPLASGIKRHGKVTFSGIDDVTDPNTGAIRRMRLLRGSTSIWEDEQTNFKKEYVNKNQLSLEFDNETCILHNTPEDRLKKQFATICNSNLSNEGRQGFKKDYFEVWNPDAISDKLLAKEMLEIEAVTLASSQPYEKMKRHATYLGISFVDEVSGLAVSEKQLRNRYMLSAKRDPKKFIDSADKEVTEIAYLIKVALDKAKIDTSKIKGQAFWNDGGFICQIPSGKQPLEYLIEFAMLKTEESAMFKAQLKHIEAS